MNLPPIGTPTTSWELRNRALAGLNGEARSLSRVDQERRRRVLEQLDEDAAREIRQSWLEPPEWPGMWGKP